MILLRNVMLGVTVVGAVCGVFCEAISPVVSVAQEASQAIAPAQPKAGAAQAERTYPASMETALGERIAALLAEAAVSHAHWGIAVTAMDGTPLYGLGEGEFFRPASVAKLYTTTAAMALLGPGATVRTEVQGSQPDAEGVVTGDVRLIGDGDANLSGVIFPYIPVAGESGPATEPLRAIDDLATQVAAAGVRHITGGVVGDDTRWAWEPYPESWAVDDVVWGYGAPVSSLSVNDSAITLTVRAGAHAGDPAAVAQSPDVGFYTVDLQLRTVEPKAATHVEVDRAPGSRVVTVRGELAKGSKDVETLAVSDPPLFAAEALRSSLIAHGVNVDGAALADERPASATESFLRQSHEPVLKLPLQGMVLAQDHPCVDACLSTLASRTSPTLAEDEMYTLKESQNLHAEMLLRRLGKAWGSDGSGAQGARVVRQFLLHAGLSGDDFEFFDGSGLSAKDLVTPRATVQLLAYAARQSWFPQWKAALPVGGVDGTLSSRFRPGAGVPPEVAALQGKVFAKTGTLGESRALAGYMEAASGKTVIFSIFCDDHLPGSSADRKTMDAMVAAIAAAN
jgi:D-alanyl-D-alanine carboxypeptidase/D-alanyl-D-alanine-endopeptidase (penicillin-binding protein 4)